MKTSDEERIDQSQWSCDLLILSLSEISDRFLGPFYQRRSSLIVINCQSLIDSTKQQTRLVSQRPIKLTNVGETGIVNIGLKDRN